MRRGGGDDAEDAMPHSRARIHSVADATPAREVDALDVVRDGVPVDVRVVADAVVDEVEREGARGDVARPGGRRRRASVARAGRPARTRAGGGGASLR